MPTNDERREIAARLREGERDFTLSFECIMHNAITGDRECGVDAFCEDCCKDIQERLAYLIEPEPERTCGLRSRFTGMYCYECSECGHGMKPDWNYCPNCGARVKEEPDAD